MTGLAFSDENFEWLYLQGRGLHVHVTVVVCSETVALPIRWKSLALNSDRPTKRMVTARYAVEAPASRGWYISHYAAIMTEIPAPLPRLPVRRRAAIFCGLEDRAAELQQ
jgi:hypothetical protein